MIAAGHVTIRWISTGLIILVLALVAIGKIHSCVMEKAQIATRTCPARLEKCQQTAIKFREKIREMTRQDATEHWENE